MLLRLSAWPQLHARPQISLKTLLQHHVKPRPRHHAHQHIGPQASAIHTPHTPRLHHAQRTSSTRNPRTRRFSSSTANEQVIAQKPKTMTATTRILIAPRHNRSLSAIRGISTTNGSSKHQENRLHTRKPVLTGILSSTYRNYALQ